MNPPHRPQAARRKALRALLTGLVLAAAGAVPLAAQEAEAPSRVPVSGQVVDRSTGRPLPGAVVEVAGTHLTATTDGEGRFAFRRVRPGEHTLRVGLLGYADVEASVRVGEGQGTVALAMDPDPVVLEGLTVKMNLLERRRRAVAVASRAYGREQIRSSASPHLEAFVRGHGGGAMTSCPSPDAFADTCVWQRGRYVPVSVYLDEMPIHFVGHLMSIHPNEVELVEVYQNGRVVRVYTSWFMELVARGKRRLDPVFLR